ncbi:glycosyltransferase family 9 protein [Arenibacter certesii]|uniref:Heptosyltransferase n=1 Tax=Arenibacter certesii TaxID=228955 RepID=A0A918J2D9_9FLAO|nr:glycosyltransferase family 9 protein [Arenibacter certesii]GGW43652.1 heptosyltransferase [Arenibacter certesii]
MDTGKNLHSQEVHILVIRMSAMGDVAMTVPIIAGLLQHYPNTRITVLTKGFFKPIFEGLPRLTVFEADVKGKHKGVLGLWRLYNELKLLQIDVVADLHNVMRSNVLRAFFAMGATRFVQIDKGRTEKGALTSLSKKVFKPLKTTHQRYADVFSTLGFPVPLEEVNLLPIRRISSKTQMVIKDTTKQWIGIAPFAAFDGKMYPLDLMEKVVAGLNSAGLFHILLFGGGEMERTKLAIWEDKYENCLNLVGKIPFKEELAVISQLKLMIAMDSGNAHLSAMFGVPCITLWGVTHPYAGFYPFGQGENVLVSDREKYPLIPTSVYGNKFPSGYENAMRSISPELVLGKALEILKVQ